MVTYAHVTPNHPAILLLLSKTNLNGLATLGARLGVGGAGKAGAGIGTPLEDAKEV